MQEKTTLSLSHVVTSSKKLAFALCLMLFSMNLSAQNYCADETVLWAEDFGTGTTATSHPDVVNIIFAPGTDFLNDNYYRIINNTQQRGEWHNAPNHTASSVNGKMLVVNGSAETFYIRTITNGSTGFLPGSYAASLFLMNVNTPGTCAPAPLLPTITFQVEYNTSATGTTGWIQLQSVTANAVPQVATPTWNQLGGVFNLPVPAQRVRLTLTDGTASGCGNDFAIDDIKFATCPEGGPLPVNFLSLNAAVKGGGVAINWNTSFESNNRYFDVEKSLDGNNWTTINSVNGSGNSSVVKTYSSYDAKPIAGNNYYRIRQVDTDGRFKFSDVAKVKVVIEKTGISVVANPFVNNIVVDFLSPINQNLSVRIMDISGKVLGAEKWKITKGSSRMNYSNVNNLQKGMYIFTVTDEDGNIIYNNKLVKQ